MLGNLILFIGVTPCSQYLVNWNTKEFFYSSLLGLQKFCVFGVGIYVKSWFLSRLPTAAPANDLRLLKLLVDTDSPAAKGALKKRVVSSGISVRSW